MLEYGGVTGLPGKYRITLALSVALLLHTLVMSMLPFTLPETGSHRQTVRVELVRPGSLPSPDATPSTSAESRETSPAQSDVETDAPRASPQPDVVAVESTRPRTDSRESPQGSSALPEERNTEASPQPDPARESSATAAGTPDAEIGDEPEPVTQITHSPRETDPYTVSLAAHVGQELDKRPVPSSRRVKEPVTMELELQLLGNGALTSANVSKSSGFGEIDQAVYRAALLASPYPEPPEDYSGRKRFRVELIFAPERL